MNVQVDPIQKIRHLLLQQPTRRTFHKLLALVEESHPPRPEFQEYCKQVVVHWRRENRSYTIHTLGDCSPLSYQLIDHLEYAPHTPEGGEEGQIVPVELFQLCHQYSISALKISSMLYTSIEGFGDLDTLEELDLSKSSRIKFIPSSPRFFSQLKRLNLHKNWGIQGVLHRLQTKRELEDESAWIEQQEHQEDFACLQFLYECSALEELSIPYGLFIQGDEAVTIAERFEQQQSLRSLCLNNIYDYVESEDLFILPSSLRELALYDTLGLRNYSFLSHSSEQPGILPNLEKITIVDGRFLQRDFEYCQHLKHIELIFAYVPSLEGIECCRHLISFSLYGSSLAPTVQNIDKLTQCQKLRSLTLGRVNFTNQALEFLRDLPALEELSLMDSYGLANHDFLQGCQHLNFLDLSLSGEESQTTSENEDFQPPTSLQLNKELQTGHGFFVFHSEEATKQPSCIRFLKKIEAFENIAEFDMLFT